MQDNKADIYTISQQNFISSKTINNNKGNIIHQISLDMFYYINTLYSYNESTKKMLLFLNDAREKEDIRSLSNWSTVAHCE